MKSISLKVLLTLLWLLPAMTTLNAATRPVLTNVKVTAITPENLNVYKSYIGHIKPKERVIVRSETSGTVEKITFGEGDQVNAGQVLVHISTQELELRKAIAETNYLQAVSDYQVERKLYFRSAADSGNQLPAEHVSLQQLKLQAALTKTDFDHAFSEFEIQKQLFEKSMASTTTYESYRTTLEIKRLTWQQAELQLEQARVKDQARLESFENTLMINQVNLKLAALELEKSKVRAPFAGIVKEKTVQLGGFIQKGSDLMEIMDISSVLVRITIPEKEMRYAAINKPVVIRVDASLGEEFQGSIKTLGLEADLKCRCFPADVIIDNAGKKLLPGMMARVEMLAITEANQVIVPRHAVLEREKGSMVFVVKNGKAMQIPVLTGEMIGENIQIVQGLTFGDELIVVGQDLIVNNEPVNVVNNHPKIARM